ncbi:MAG: hypothetical protein AAGI49_06955 [Bacteroidota bacterium]
MKKKYTDLEIVAGIKAGGRSKELVLLWLCRQRLYRQHARLEAQGLGIRVQSDQYSIFNDSMLALVKAIEQERYQPAKASILTYWKKIHRNKCLKFINRKSTPPTEELHENMPVTERTEAAAAIEAILASFEIVAPKCTALLSLVFAGYEAADIADRLGYANANTIGVIKVRCIKRLRASMKN